jgi:hypothetical protein
MVWQREAGVIEMAASGILKLQRAGFSEQRVEALADYFDDQMATKADLVAVRADLAAAEARLETKIEQARSDTIKWVVGVGFAQVATILVVLRFLPAGHP